MRAFLAIAAAIGSVALLSPGYALDVGVSAGGGVSGGVSAGGDVSAGGGGVSAGGDVSGGGVSAGGDVSAGGGGVSAGGDVSGGVSAGGDVSEGGVSGGEAATGEVAIAPVPMSTGLRFAVLLPPALLPSCASRPENCSADGATRSATSAKEVAGAFFGGGIPEAVTVCRDAMVKDAAQFGALSVDAFTAGRVRASGTGGQIASLTVRIQYPGEVKEAPVECHLDASGTVVAVEAT
jgi:hypothetical protein